MNMCILFHRAVPLAASVTGLWRWLFRAVIFGAPLISAIGQDAEPPRVILLDPLAGSVRTELNFITVTFDDGVTGVNAADLLINGGAATNVAVLNPREYTFHFPQPGTGTVQVAWATNHGITDLSLQSNAFAGGSWSYVLDPATAPAANVIISEFMADNENGIRDDDGNRSDWIEILNVGPLEVNLEGWYLTDNQTNLTKWRFPAAVLQANRRLIVWASEKNRTNPAAALHTNFRLNNDGEYLALVGPSGTNPVSFFSPTYPAQRNDVSYGRDASDPNRVGYFLTPTPGAQNTAGGTGFAADPIVALQSGVYTNSSLMLSMVVPSNAVVRYTVDGSVPRTNSTQYSAPFTFSTNMTFKARSFPLAGSDWPSRVVVRTFLMLDAAAAAFSSKLPVLVLSTPGRGIVESLAPGLPRTKGSFLVVDTRNGRSTLRTEPDFQGLAEFEIFGQTSAGFPKKPYNIEIQDELGNDLDASILGMPADADWKLRNPYSDKPMLMDFLAYELFDQMGNNSVRRRFVEVFVDTDGGKLTYPGDYHGVLLLTERIELGDDRVDIARLTPAHTNEPSITGGYIFKKDKDSTGDLNFSTAGGAGGFPSQNLKLHEPKPREVNNNVNHPQVAWLRTYLNRMEQSLYAANWLTAIGTNHYSYYLDPDAFVDQHWIVEFPKQIDGYRLSDFYTKDRLGRVKPEPIWDWNLSFGNANYLQGGYTNGWYYALIGPAEHMWIRRLITGTTSATSTSGDPDFNQKIADRWGVLRTNIMNGPRLLARIDELADLLSEAAVRDNSRFPRWGTYIWPNPDGARNGDLATLPTADPWSVDYQNPRSYPELIAQMKKWVMGRYLWIDAQFANPPRLSRSDSMVTNGSTLTITGPSGATIYYTTNGTDPRALGGNPAAGAQTYSAPITVNGNMRVVARARRTGTWNNTWSGLSAATLFTLVPSLRITEIMYHPAEPPVADTNDVENFEFIEVKNIGSLPLNLAGYRMDGGIDFVFSNAVLNAGQAGVIVRDRAAFHSRYGSNMLVLGTYTGSLNNGGDHLILRGSFGEPILDFSYSEKWHPATDGFGFSLIVADENANPSTWGTSANWRASSAIGGSPGTVDPAAPARPIVVINEVLSHSETNGSDVIELHNTTASPVNIVGWFLTDDFRTPQKYIIPNMVIQPGGFVLFNETHFNPGGTGFALGAGGDEVYLFSGNGTNITGYVHGFDFGGSALNTTLGRYVVSTGEDHLVLQRTPTLGTTNAGPLIGPVVITEISYHPTDVIFGLNAFDNVEDEFIELQNITASPVQLFDPAYPTNRWRLGDAVDFVFPTNTIIPAGTYALVVSFDPLANPTALANFRARNLVPPNVPVYGPWDGTLGNDGERVELRRPDAPDLLTGAIENILVERISYSGAVPWPVAADGLGPSLQRRVNTAYGNDPANWAAGASTPGGPYIGGTAPTILTQPSDQLIVAPANVALTVTASGPEPLRFQWVYNGRNIPGATSPTLTITNFQVNQAGVYNVFVYNNAGVALGQEFTISTRVRLQITAQPVSRSLLAGQTNTFSVTAVGTGSLRYQWRLNDVDLPGATNPSLIIANVQATNQGVYTVAVNDDFDAIVSQPASLTIITRPAFVVEPLSQTVTEGGTVSFSAAGSGTTPISFRWRRAGLGFTPNGYIINSPSQSVLTLTNVTMADNGIAFSVTMTNIAGQATRASVNAVLTVLADFDRDGLPDIWEEGRPGYSTNDVTDATRDDDGDSMNNRAEYIAGTDPANSNSILRVEITTGGPARVQFVAVSNRVYSVEFSDSLNPPVWNKLTDVVARDTTRTETVIDPAPSPRRYYRIVTPVLR